MIIALVDNYNDCSFAVKFDDKTVLEKVKKYMREGLEAWYCAAHEPIDYDGDLFTKSEVASFYDLGYAEPTSILLDRDNIKHEILKYNENESYTDIIEY